MTIPGFTPLPHINKTSLRAVDHAYFLEWLTAQAATTNSTTYADSNVTTPFVGGLMVPIANPSADPVPTVTNGRSWIRAQNITNVGLLRGSPWGGYYLREASPSTLTRVIQHSLPSQAKFNDIISNNSQVALELVARSPLTDVISESLASLNRNGYTSLSYASSSLTSDEYASVYFMVYWDFDDNEAKIIKPLRTVGPAQFSITAEEWPINLDKWK